MGRLSAKNEYENLRNARISENQARLASLGLEKTAADLNSTISSTKPSNTLKRKNPERIYDCKSLRRSERLKGKPTNPTSPPKEKLSLSEPSRRRLFNKTEGEEESRPANAPFLSIDPLQLKERLSPHILARRCDSKSRGSVYDPILGICCHFCRQKKLCGEEDCQRCGNGDIDQPCLGKTDCSVCHSSTGVLCRACLKVRYGEELEEVRENGNWMCPHCIEAQRLKPYWICNSSFCLKKRKISPTGIAIFEAREKGYKSVAHLLMDQLKQAAGLQCRS